MRSKIDYFDSEVLRKDLKDKTVRGGIITGSTQFLKILVGLASMAVLSRLLDIEDFGLIGMVAVFTNFASMFINAGLAMATVQQKEITHQQVSNLFWVAAGLGCLCALLVALLSPAIAAFYGESRLVLITLTLACSYLLIGLTIQHQALLRRGMQFNLIAISDLTSLIIGQSVGIAIAYSLYNSPEDYWALAIIPIASALSRMSIIWLTCGWVPSLPSWDKSVFPMLRYGLNLSVGQFINYLARNGDSMLIGWYWGESQLGLYDRAYKLLLFPITAINGPMANVAVPALSRLKDDPQAYRRFFRKGVQISTALVVPIVTAVAVVAEPLVLTILSEKWRAVVPVFLALAPVTLMSATAPASSWVYLSWGHTDQQLKAICVNTLVVLLGFIVALPYGIFWMAVAFSITSCVIRIPNVLFAFRPTPLQLSDMLLPMVWPSCLSFIVSVPIVILDRWLEPQLVPVLRLVIELFLFGLLYLLAYSTTTEGRKDVKSLQAYVSQKIKAKRKKANAVR